MQRLDAAMALLRDASKKLNSASDNASDLVRAAEDFLNRECSVGVFARVLAYTSMPEGECGPSVSTCLAYAKVNGRYRICIVWENDVEDEMTVKPWAEATREDKLDTVGKLPDLIAEIAAKVSDEAAVANQTVSGVQAALNPLIAKKGA